MLYLVLAPLFLRATIDKTLFNEVKTPVLGKKMVQGAFLNPN